MRSAKKNCEISHHDRAGGHTCARDEYSSHIGLESV